MKGWVCGSAVVGSALGAAVGWVPVVVVVMLVIGYRGVDVLQVIFFSWMAAVVTCAVIGAAVGFGFGSLREEQRHVRESKTSAPRP